MVWSCWVVSPVCCALWGFGKMQVPSDDLIEPSSISIAHRLLLQMSGKLTLCQQQPEIFSHLINSAAENPLMNFPPRIVRTCTDYEMKVYARFQKKPLRFKCWMCNGWENVVWNNGRRLIQKFKPQFLGRPSVMFPHQGFPKKLRNKSSTPKHFHYSFMINSQE